MLKRQQVFGCCITAWICANSDKDDVGFNQFYTKDLPTSCLQHCIPFLRGHSNYLGMSVEPTCWNESRKTYLHDGFHQPRTETCHIIKVFLYWCNSDYINKPNTIWNSRLHMTMVDANKGTFWHTFHWFHWLITGISPRGGQGCHGNAQSLLCNYGARCPQNARFTALCESCHWKCDGSFLIAR